MQILATIINMAKQGQLVEFVVESLVHQCYHYIAMNLEQFPVSYLSLLPLRVREELLWRLPIADLCMLEDTEYVEGFQDMAAYWKLPCKQFRDFKDRDPDVGHYFEKWDDIEYAREILYGQVITAVIGYMPSRSFFYLPFDELGLTKLGRKTNMILFLYAVRKPAFRFIGSGCKLLFPHRYQGKDGLTSKKDIVDAVIGCFKGELPIIVPEMYLYEYLDDEYYDLFNKVMYLGVHGIFGKGVFERPSLYFLKQVIQRSTWLEVVILEPPKYWDAENKSSINTFVTFLSTQVRFLSNFQLLKILDPYRIQTRDYLLPFAGYSVLQKNLNKLVTAYFSAPTTHLQKILITDAEIKSYDDDCPPVIIDQRYLQFKVIELDNCRFVSRQKSTHRAITQWLGQDISTLRVEMEEGGGTKFCSFKIKEQALGKKRKHSEVDSEDTKP